MRSDYVETLVVGSDYISTLTAMLCFEKKSSVSLLSGYNFYQDPIYISELTALDFYYLKALGENFNISAIKNLDAYIVNSPFTFHTDSCSVILGRDFKSNFLECLRKMPELFNDEEVSNVDLDQLALEHENYLVNCVERLYGLPDLSKFREALLIDDQNHYITLKKLFVFDNENSQNASTLRCLSGVFENFIPKKQDDLYQASLILNLLSPFYLLNSDKLNEDLLKEFKDNEGSVLIDKIESFSIRGKKLEGVRLEQLGKTFHFEEFIGVGHPQEDLQMKVNCRENSFMSVNFVFDKVMRFPESLGRFDYVVKKRWLGSSIQSLHIQHYSDRVIASFAVSAELQAKLKDSFIEYLQDELEAFVRQLGFKGKYTLAPYIFNEFDWRYREQKRRSLKKALSDELTTRYIWLGEQKQIFTNSRYLGQFSLNPLGKVSLFNKVQRVI